MDEETFSQEVVANKKAFSRRTLIKGSAIVGGTIWVAPVIDSLTNVAAAQSTANFCCSCWPGHPGPTATSPKVFQGEADEHPPSASTCASYCLGLSYANFTFCGPSAPALTYVSSADSPGCYTGSATSLTAALGCVAGTTSPFNITETNVPGTTIT